MEQFAQGAFACRYIPFGVCAALILYRRISFWAWKLGLGMGHGVRFGARRVDSEMTMRLIDE
jgi:hypothetical protein